MKNQILKSPFVFSLFLFLAAPLAFAETPKPQPQPITLEKLDPDKDIQIGCGCAVSNEQGDYLVFSEPEADAPATVRIDGKKRELKAVENTQKSRAPRVGDRFYKTYRDGKLKMRLDHKTTYVCPAKDDSCEVTRYSVDIRLEEGKRKNVLKGLLGECGC